MTRPLRPRPWPPQNSRFVPSSENWAAVEASTVLPDMLVAIAEGGDVKTEAAKADDAIVRHPQRLTRDRKGTEAGMATQLTEGVATADLRARPGPDRDPPRAVGVLRSRACPTPCSCRRWSCWR